MSFKELCLINYCTGEQEEEGLEGLVQGCELFLTIFLSSVKRLFREVRSQSICIECEEERSYASSALHFNCFRIQAKKMKEFSGLVFILPN